MLPVLIAGGGIGGLALALALAQKGIESRVLEARLEPPRDGAGIQLGPNATRILQALGIADSIRTHAVSPQSIIVNDGISGRELTRLPLGSWLAERHRAPYWVIHRADLLQVLWTKAQSNRSITLETGRNVATVEDDAETQQVTVQFADGETATGAILVGADGLWSRVRGHINPGYVPTYAGAAAARALVPRHKVAAQFRECATGVWLAPNAHVVHYPVNAGDMVAIVAIGHCAEPTGGWSSAVERDTIAERFHQLPGAVRGLLDVAADWRQWALYKSAPLQWSSGRSVLIGDAAHPILPYLAQGGALAIEDAFALAGVIAHPGTSAADAIKSFGDIRQERATKVQAASEANGRVYHLAGAAAAARNASLKFLPGSFFMRQYDWIYGHQA